MAISVPSYGTPGFIITEDKYNLYDSVAAEVSGNNSPQEVIFSCPHKRGRVSGILDGGLKLNIKSEWTEMMGGGIMSLAGSVVDTANNLLQLAAGASVQQPWMNRKMWKTTKPFSFDVPMSFVAMTDPLNDVVRPVMALVSFLYPRKLQIKDKNTGEMVDANMKNFGDNTGISTKLPDDVGVIGTALSSIGLYNIPGPSIRYTSKNSGGSGEDNIGDPVYVTIGKIFSFGSCYLESVDVQFSPSMDSDGFPIAAKCTVKVTVMDSGVVETNGQFMIQEFSNTSESFGQFIDAVATTVGDLATNLANVIKSTIGFYKPE